MAVYVIASDSLPIVKVGFSWDVSQRMNVLKYQYLPDSLTLLYERPYLDVPHEKFLHKVLKGKGFRTFHPINTSCREWYKKEIIVFIPALLANMKRLSESDKDIPLSKYHLIIKLDERNRPYIDYEAKAKITKKIMYR